MYERSLPNMATFQMVIWGQNFLYPSESSGSQGGNYGEEWHRAL